MDGDCRKKAHRTEPGNYLCRLLKFIDSHIYHFGSMTRPDFCNASTSAKYSARIRRIFSAFENFEFFSNASSSR